MKRLIEFLFGRKTRNKAGGMAWVVCKGLHSGAESLRGAAVKTVSIDRDGAWLIEPKLGYIATRPHHFADGKRFLPGDAVLVCAIADDSLEPWKDAGITDKEVRELYAPRIPTKEAQS